MIQYFIITIDTEGDDIWEIKDPKAPVSVENSKFLFRFQELCEKYQLIPTYLTNYEMAKADAFIELGRNGLKRGTLEIGAHEHAWNQPPYFPLPKRIGKCGKPRLDEYPKFIIREKLKTLTHMLEDTFQCNITSHRGGRWNLDERIVEELETLGYIVDCTCTPGLSWIKQLGWTPFSKGTNWESWDNKVDRLKYVHRKDGESSKILEVPVTIFDVYNNAGAEWLRPNGRNASAMKKIIQKGVKEKYEFLEFMLHSSELMPGGSKRFKSESSIDALYRDIEEVFICARENGFQGIGLSAFANHIYKQ